jgi:hypothetical protein
MTYNDYTATDIHRAAVDQDIDAIRTERLLAAETSRAGLGDRFRRATGRLLIATGTALIGRERVGLRTHRA